MKKLFTLSASIACILLFMAMNVNGQWNTTGNDIYNTNTGNVGIGTNTPGYLLHVAKNTTSPSIRIQNLGGGGGAAFEMIDNASTADWKFKATNSGGFKIRDHASALDVLTIEKNALANALYIKQGGNVGLGVTNPLEKLHVNGAVLIGNTSTSNAGTIRWNGSNFSGYNGSSWVNLDFTWSDPWIQLPNIPYGNPEFCSGPQPMSLSFAFPGVANPMARLYVTDMSAIGLFPHQIEIEGSTLGGPVVFNASQLFRMSAGMNPPFIDYSVGIFGMDGTFKVCLGAALTATAQSDNTTMIRTNQSGIVDLPNQSRIRAYQVDPSGAGLVQTIPPGIWTPVNFTFDTPLPVGYDEQFEFVLAPAVNMPTPVENAFFAAVQEGYYQVNARCEFNVETIEGGPVMVAPNSYVSIAIYTGAAPGITGSNSIGNNLQIGYMNGPDHLPLTNNNAPNVSDVIYLLPGQIISIWVYHTAMTPMNLRQGPNIMYVSIHKVS